MQGSPVPELSFFSLTRAGIDSYRQQPSNFLLFRSEHAHGSYPGLPFRPPGFSPYMGREERRVQGLEYMQGKTRQSQEF